MNRWSSSERLLRWYERFAKIREAIDAFTAAHNQSAAPFEWTKTVVRQRRQAWLHSHMACWLFFLTVTGLALLRVNDSLVITRKDGKSVPELKQRALSEWGLAEYRWVLYIHFVAWGSTRRCCPHSEADYEAIGAASPWR